MLSIAFITCSPRFVHVHVSCAIIYTRAIVLARESSATRIVLVPKALVYNQVLDHLNKICGSKVKKHGNSRSSSRN